MINNVLLKKLFDLKTPEFEVSSLGIFSSHSSSSFLTFIEGKKYVRQLNGNANVRVVFTTEKISNSLRDDIISVIVDDPKWYFFQLVDYFGKNRVRETSKVSQNAKVHSSTVIAEKGVIIKEGVVIEANVTINSDVIIESGAIIRAGAVLGSEDAAYVKTTRGMFNFSHDGLLIIKKGASVGENSRICKGFSYRNTIIGKETRIDALVNYGHGVQSGYGCMISASVMIGGHVTLGNEVWLGPNSTISNRINVGDRASVTLGSVVVQNVEDGKKVSGNFAVPHINFIKKFAKESFQ